MLEAIKAMIANASQRKFEDSDYRLAAAALLVHVAEADGRVVEAERIRMRGLLVARFGLDEAASADLLRAAAQSDHEAADFSTFTATLNRALNDDERRKIVEMLWEVAFADGELHEFEDSAIWRIAELLGISQSSLPEIYKRGPAKRADT